MRDLIDRQAALDALDRLEYTPGEWATNGLTMCKDAIKALPSAQPGWIPCSERLPKLNGYYLATIMWGEDFYEVDCYEYDSYYKEWNDGELYGGTVVAWMPLPKPWEGDANG